MVFGHHRTTVSHGEARATGIIVRDKAPESGANPARKIRSFDVIIELDASNHFR
jgi:hypothetical protein